MRTTVPLVSTLIIHPAIKAPTHCAICQVWNIERTATHFGQWEDQNGPDHYIGVCNDCRMSGFEVIGTIEEFKECQSRTFGLAEYEIWRADGIVRAAYNRSEALGIIRSTIRSAVAVLAINQRIAGEWIELGQGEQSDIVFQAMSL